MGAYDLSFEYNESGIRTSKTVNGVTHEYVVDGTKIISDCWLDSAVRHYIAYIYDAKGVIGMAYRNHTMDEDEFEYYIFEKNLQGDIIAVYDEYGFAAVTYTYDAWGNVTETLYDTTSNGQYNSFRYRGYFYDEDTELYYLNSRYYDPATGRFLNPDIYVNANGDLTGFNMYAYCSNNPVIYVDNTGESLSAAIFGGEMAIYLSYVAYELLKVAVVVAIAGTTVAILEEAADSIEESTTTFVDDNDFDQGPRKDDKIYYGARIWSGNFRIMTGPMDYDEAVTWAYAISPSMGKNSKWGIYTYDINDAIKIAPALTPLEFKLEDINSIRESLIFDKGDEGHYSHFHLPNRMFNQKHSHFHLWFGALK